MTPGYVSGALLVFIWTFADFITPLVLGVQDLLAPQAYLNIMQFVDRRIFRMGIVISALLVVLAIFFVLAARQYVALKDYSSLAYSRVERRRLSGERGPGGGRAVGRWTFRAALAATQTGAPLSLLMLQLAGLPGRWFTAPAAPVQDQLLREGHTADDAALDIGDSAVIECTGLGGMALAAAPAVAAFFGGDAAAAVARTELMAQICATRSSRFSIGGRGTPVGIDARLVAELGITPQITTGVLHVRAGTGQIGAGVAHQPVEPFRAALAALAASYG